MVEQYSWNMGDRVVPRVGYEAQINWLDPTAVLVNLDKNEPGTVTLIANNSLVNVLWDASGAETVIHRNNLRPFEGEAPLWTPYKTHVLKRETASSNAAVVSVGGSKYGKTGRVRLVIGDHAAELTESEVNDLLVMLEFQREVSNGRIKP